MNRILDAKAITLKLTKSLGSIVVIKPVLDRLKVADTIDKSDVEILVEKTQKPYQHL